VKKRIISGIMVTMFLVTMVTVAFPVQVSASTGDPIVIGLIGPMGWIQWDGIKEGAIMARDIINNAPANDKGMWDGSEYHLIQFVEIDEHGVPVPDPTAGVTELLTALDTHPDMQFLMGGFQEGCVLPIREAAMDYAALHKRPIWDICGTSVDQFIDDGPAKDNPYDDVRENYERYKYMFRSDPMNATWLGKQLFAMAGMLQIPKLKAVYGIPQDGLLPTYIIAEDLIWVEAILSGPGGLLASADLLGLDIVGVGRPSSIETDFGPFLDAIEASGAKLIIHTFSAVAGATFIKQWGERKVPAVPVGINVESQMLEFYASVGGKCEYETIMSALGTRTNINPNAKPLSTVEFWDAYSAKFGHAPIYTAWGSYLYPLLLNKSCAQWYGKQGDEIIPIIEATYEPDTYLGVFRYTTYHDLYCDEYSLAPIWPPASGSSIGTIRAHLPQWQAGRLEIVWPRGYNLVLMDPTPLPWARKWKIPPWVYSLGETDFAGGPSIPIPPPKIAADAGLPTGLFGTFTSADGTVGPADMTPATSYWQQTCPWTLLEADMDGNQFIDIDDVARVALDWGKTA